MGNTKDFAGSCEGIWINSHGILTARANTGKNQIDFNDVSLDTNRYFGNEDGRFVPGKSGYVAVAKDIHSDRRVIHLPGDSCRMFAKLKKNDGSWVDAAIDLNEYIGNDSGNLVTDLPAGR